MMTIAVLYVIESDGDSGDNNDDDDCMAYHLY